MPTLTRNLFWGQGPGDHRLEVVAGTWPADLAGSVFVVGPDKRRPDGHWFGAHGLLEKIHLVPDADGRILVEHRLVDTPLARVRRRLPFLFTSVQFMEVSPFGVSNLANTGVQPLGDRLYVGYDAGRPVEVDPETLDFLTPVGANDEWFQALPGLLEPLCAVAAHPAPDLEERALYFVNYTQVSPPDVAAETYLARWDTEGPVHRWRVEGMSPFDSIHDVKATEHHVVFADLPFVFEPETFRGAARQRRNQDHTSLWIVAKEELRATPPGGTVKAVEVRVPMPTGHLFVDHEEVDGHLRILLQQIPLSDLMITMTRDSIAHGSGRLIDPNYEGLIALAVQPSVVTEVIVDPSDGRVVSRRSAVDEEQVWGGVLLTSDVHHPEAVRRHRTLWCASAGFDPELIPEEWWRLYGDATDGVVAPADLPDRAIPGSLSRFDLRTMQVADVYSYADGAFPSPPTFVPRRGASGPDDGYVVAVVHRDGPKEVQVFDAHRLAAGPVARATAPTFNPSLLLHSCWMPDRVGPRSSGYHVPVRRDVRGAVGGVPAVMKAMARTGKAMKASLAAGAAGAPGAAGGGR